MGKNVNINSGISVMRRSATCKVVLGAMIVPLAHAFSPMTSHVPSLRLSNRRYEILSSRALLGPKLPSMSKAASGIRAVGARSIQMGLADTANLVDNVLHYPQTWTFALTGVLLALGWGFEKGVETLEDYVDKRLMPVVKQSVFELATLGFIGLVIEATLMGSETSWLSAISEHFTGDHDVLFEQLELLHQGLFATTITFFGVAALLIGNLNAQFQEWGYERRNDYLRFKLDEYEWKLANTSKPYAMRGWNYLAQRMVIKDEVAIEGNVVRLILDEIAKPRKARIAEFLRFRERFIVQARNDGIPLPSNFEFSDYLEEHASNNLRKIVNVDIGQQAQIWMPVGVLALLAETTADAALGAGHEGAGLFFVFCLSQVALGVWSVWNFFKMRYIRAGLRPQLSSRKLAKCAQCTCQGFVCNRRGYQIMRLLPPAYALAGGLRAVGGSSTIARAQKAANQWAVLENLNAAPALTRHDALFGPVGSNGPAFYLQCIKLNLFNAIVSLAVGTNMLLHSDSKSAAATMLLALLPAVSSIAVAPATFMNYNWATSVESRKDLTALRKVLSEQRESAFRSKIRTLFKLCLVFDTVCGLGVATCSLTDKAPSWQDIRLQGNPDALLNLLAVFSIVDLDTDGYISRTEAAVLAAALGYRLTSKELDILDALMNSKRGDGYITFQEFSSTVMYTGLATVTDERQTMRRVFSFFDRAGTGFITDSEMFERLAVLGFDTQGVEELFAAITGSRKGAISREAFTTYVKDDYEYIQSSTQRINQMDLRGDAKRLRAARYAQEKLAIELATEDAEKARVLSSFREPTISTVRTVGQWRKSEAGLAEVLEEVEGVVGAPLGGQSVPSATSSPDMPVVGQVISFNSSTSVTGQRISTLETLVEWKRGGGDAEGRGRLEEEASHLRAQVARTEEGRRRMEEESDRLKARLEEAVKELAMIAEDEEGEWGGVCRGEGLAESDEDEPIVVKVQNRGNRKIELRAEIRSLDP